MIYALTALLFVSLVLAAATALALLHVDKQLDGLRVKLSSEF